MGHKHHRAEAEARVREVKFSVYVVSTSRYELLQQGEEVEDISGDLAVRLIEKSGFVVLNKKIIPDSRTAIIRAVDEALRLGSDAILFIGGTGITRDDITVETLELVLEKRLDGFGELFRVLSYREIGSAALLSRAIAGLCKGAIIFAMPGHPNAVKLALEKLILPEIRHMVYMAKHK